MGDGGTGGLKRRGGEYMYPHHVLDVTLPSTKM